MDSGELGLQRKGLSQFMLMHWEEQGMESQGRWTQGQVLAGRGQCPKTQDPLSPAAGGQGQGTGDRGGQDKGHFLQEGQWWSAPAGVQGKKWTEAHPWAASTENRQDIRTGTRLSGPPGH